MKANDPIKHSGIGYLVITEEDEYPRGMFFELETAVKFQRQQTNPENWNIYETKITIVYKPGTPLKISPRFFPEDRL